LNKENLILDAKFGTIINSLHLLGEGLGMGASTPNAKPQTFPKAYK